MQHVKSHTSRLWMVSVLLISFGMILITCPAIIAQTEDSGAAAASAGSSLESHKWGLSFGGLLMSGRVSTALLPITEEYGDMNPIESPYGFGLCIDYNMGPKVRLFVDGNFYTYRKQVGIADMYSSSFWVFEMSDYEDNRILFDQDAYFYMQTTGIRAGIKYGILKESFRPWAGVGFGLYAWKADYMTEDRSKTWGGDSGTVAGPTFLVGVDFIFGRESSSPMVFTIYGDFTSPVVNEKISDLFQDGWTWDNVTGSHVMGPYRFGVSIGFLH